MRSNTKGLLSLAWSIGAGVAMLGLTTTSASAQATLTGCYVPNSGTVYRIKAEGLPDACRGKSHVEFTWSLQGPQGPAGPAGPTGPQGPTGPAGGLARSAMQIVVKTVSAGAGGGVAGAIAECPAGTVATGGGGSTPNVQVRLVNSRPTNTNGVPTGWEATMQNATDVIQLVSVYAVCAPAQ
jgi:hypothetical protein